MPTEKKYIMKALNTLEIMYNLGGSSQIKKYFEKLDKADKNYRIVEEIINHIDTLGENFLFDDKLKENILKTLTSKKKKSLVKVIQE